MGSAPAMLRRDWLRRPRRPALALDFAPRPRRIASWVLLAAGVAALAVLLAWQERLQQREQVLASRARQALGPLKTSDSPQAAARQRVQTLMARELQLPWDRVFVALEATAQPDIALLGVKSEAREGRVEITGEARDFAALWAYLGALEQASGLHDVYLSRHEHLLDVPGQPVRFVLTARWLRGSLAP